MVKTKYFKFFPLIFIAVLVVLSLLFFSASAVGVDDSTLSSADGVSSSAGAEDIEEVTIYYDDSKLLKKLEEIEQLIHEDKESSSDSDILQSLQENEQLLNSILQELRSSNSSSSAALIAEDTQAEQGLQYQQYMLGFMIFFVLVVLCYFVYKFFNMFF